MSDRFRRYIRRFKDKALLIKREMGALSLAYKRLDVPWYAKLCTAAVIGYALSPIDLIPDFIPVLGYLDDLVVIPLGILLAVRLIPSNVMEECRVQAESYNKEGKKANWVAGSIIIAVWMAAIGLIAYKILKHFI